MAGVAENHAGLGGALVAAHLEADDALAGAELLLGPVPDVLVGFLGPDGRAVEVGSLQNSEMILMIHVNSSYKWFMNMSNDTFLERSRMLDLLVPMYK